MVLGKYNGGKGRADMNYSRRLVTNESSILRYTATQLTFFYFDISEFGL